MQDGDLLIFGYVGVAAIVWFLMGYATYRARDFRLSRTLWCGIRFDLRGSAIAYGFRRFLWSIVLIVTLGLAYPWMASSLWRYRWNNTWYGDRKFELKGNWRAIAGPYYITYIVNLLTIGATIIWVDATHDYVMVGSVPVPGLLGALYCLLCLLLLALTLAWYRTTTTSRMLSTISCGDAAIKVKMGTGALFGQFIAFAACVVGVLVLLLLTGAIALGAVYAAASKTGKEPDVNAMASFFQSGTINVALLILAYLIFLGTLGMLTEIVLGFGWWKLLARSTTITNADSLRSVRATPEDRALIGQGLADALNVGAY